MTNQLRITPQMRMRAKPPQPTNEQRIACPPGYIGVGSDPYVVQRRSVTWNVATQSWDVGPWTDYAFNCQIAVMTFTTPNVRFVPKRGGKVIAEGLQQIYGPYTVGDNQGYGYQMTLTHLVICPNDDERRSRLTIQLAGPGNVANAYVTPRWDRDYASFPPQYSNASGQCYWDVRNSEWTQYETRFTVTVQLSG